MPDPRTVFEHPEQHWDFLTASDDKEFEGQFFDRKEALQHQLYQPHKRREALQ